MCLRCSTCAYWYKNHNSECLSESDSPSLLLEELPCRRVSLDTELLPVHIIRSSGTNYVVVCQLYS
jgi:hypothetical protein